MGEHNKILPRPIFRRDVGWDPFPNWTQPSRIFTQDLGLPPFLDPGDLDWLDWARRRLASFTWPAYTQTAVLPVVSGQHPAAVDHRRLRQAEVRTGRHGWRIELDVNQFTPEEITITTKDGYVLISGNHEERQDEHGLVSRCFTRKYKLPQGVDVKQITSSLSAAGLLSVEAPVPGSDVSASATEVVVPVQIRQTEPAEK